MSREQDLIREQHLINFEDPIAERWHRCLLGDHKLMTRESLRVAWFIWTRCTRNCDGTFEVPLDEMAEEYAFVWKVDAKPLLRKFERGLQRLIDSGHVVPLDHGLFRFGGAVLRVVKGGRS